MRISERKRTTRTPETSKSVSRNTETQRNSQRSLLEGGVGSFHSPVSALSLGFAIKSERRKQSHYPPRVRASLSSMLSRINAATGCERLPAGLQHRHAVGSRAPYSR